jgi:hypothetical protein
MPGAAPSPPALTGPGLSGGVTLPYDSRQVTVKGVLMYQQATEPRSMGQVLDASFKLYTAAFRDALPLSVALAVLGCIPSIVPLLTGGALTDPLAIISVLFSPAFLLTLLLATLASFVCYIGLLVQIEAIAQGGRVALGAALEAGLRELLPVFIATILWGLITTVGLVLILVPGFIVMVSMVFAMPAIVLDDKGAVESLGYSHRLVWGDWWHTATLLSLGMAIPLVVLLVGPSLVIGIIGVIVTPGPEMLVIAQLVITGVVSALLAPYMLALMLEAYRDLKLRKEGTPSTLTVARTRGG